MIMDIKVTDIGGNQYIIEMQKSSESGSLKRFLLYGCRNYSDQLDKSENYEILKDIKTLIVTNYSIVNGKHPIAIHQLMDTSTKKCSIPYLQFCFVQLNKFKKTSVSSLNNVMEVWMYFLQHASESDFLDYIERVGIESSNDSVNTAVRHAASEIKLFCTSRKDRELYYAYTKNLMDEKVRSEAIKNEGFHEGLAEGIEIGLVEGVEKGAKAEKINIAKGMLEVNIPIEQIMKITGLTKEEIHDIKNYD
jgi:predicted transposase/invertase (TIGR01784 family)